jgi:phosphohistidine phosphatase
MRVHLVRHGEAAPASADGERPLTARGRADVADLARWCAASGLKPASIVHSGILRAAQTAQILADALAPPGGVRVARGLAPDDDPGFPRDELLHADAEVLVVTHLPFIGELAAALTGGGAAPAFATAELVILERTPGGFRVGGGWRPSATGG